MRLEVSRRGTESGEYTVARKASETLTIFSSLFVYKLAHLAATPAPTRTKNTAIATKAVL